MKEVVWVMIREDWQFTLKCLVKLYHLQKEEEKEKRVSLEENGIGFTKGDARYLTRQAEYYLLGHSIIAERVEIMKRLEKYSTQLATYEDILELLR